MPALPSNAKRLAISLASQTRSRVALHSQNMPSNLLITSVSVNKVCCLDNSCWGGEEGKLKKEHNHIDTSSFSPGFIILFLSLDQVHTLVDKSHFNRLLTEFSTINRRKRNVMRASVYYGSSFNCSQSHWEDVSTKWDRHSFRSF